MIQVYVGCTMHTRKFDPSPTVLKAGTLVQGVVAYLCLALPLICECNQNGQSTETRGSGRGKIVNVSYQEYIIKERRENKHANALC